MVITKSDLLKQLFHAITDDEWIEIAQNKEFPVSGFNRSVLLEMKGADIASGPDGIKKEDVDGLHKAIKDYLEQYFSDKQDGWKWIIISCIYLTYIAERPMHPIDSLDIKEVTVDGGIFMSVPASQTVKILPAIIVSVSGCLIMRS